MAPVPLARDAGGPGPARRRRRHPHLRGARHRADDPGARPARVPLPDGRGHTSVLEGVSFAYSDDGPDVLAGIDLDIPAGRTIALIGPTGSGKTHPHAADPALLRRHRRRACCSTASTCATSTSAPLRRAVGMVSQDPFLFSTTVRENIAYGRPERHRRGGARRGADGPGRGLHRRAAGRVRHDRGRARLSAVGGPAPAAGDRARRCITDPRVLILDEATASVDASTEREIQAALAAVMARPHDAVIAHRLSTIALADELVVLEEGRIVARGTHEELYETSDIVPRDPRRRAGAPRPDRGGRMSTAAPRVGMRDDPRGPRPSSATSCGGCCRTSAPTAGGRSPRRCC